MTTETTNNGRQLQKLEARLQDCEKRLENLDSACGSYASKEVLTLEEASLFLGLSKSQLYKLIGAAEPPYPMVSLTRKTGTPGGSPAAWEIEVKAVGRRVLLPCVF